MNHAIVTGATGEVGLSLVGELLSHSVSVTVVSRPGSKRIFRVGNHPNMNIVVCSLEEM